MLAEAVRTESLTKFFEKTGERGRIPLLRHKKTKERIVAVDRLNLSIPSGMVFGLLGPNGAGKTTTVKLLSTLLLPDQGTAFVNGFDVSRQPNSVRSIIGVVTGGERGLYWRLTGRENLLFFARLYGVREDRAKTRICELMKLVELTERADDMVEKYSRGMKQRLHLIRGLIHDPPILLLDEPTLGLDPTSAVVIREFIKEKLQKQQRKTILLTTHYMEEADQLCDNIAVIDHGRIIAQGSPGDLKSKVREYDVLRINATNTSDILPTELKNIEGVLDVKVTLTDPASAHSEIIVHSEKAAETLPQITETMVKLGVRVRAIEQLTPSLEDAFIDLTGRRLRD